VADAAAIAAIYNQSIKDRLATFETEPRSPGQIHGWSTSGLPIVSPQVADGEIVGFSAAFAYADRFCYAGVAAFSVYTRRDWRGGGGGRAALAALIDRARQRRFWKLLSRIFTDDAASRALAGPPRFRRNRRPPQAWQVGRDLARLRDRREADPPEHRLERVPNSGKRYSERVSKQNPRAGCDSMETQPALGTGGSKAILVGRRVPPHQVIEVKN
jgi:phosphinothricin acetyltransferase